MKHRLPEIALILTTIVWGATFLGTRIAVSTIGPFSFLAIRFTIGAACLWILLRRIPGRKEWKAGIIVGFVIVIGFASQTYGLKTVESAKGAFIASFYVPLVPILEAILHKVRPSRSAIAGVTLSFLGLIVISMHGDLSLSIGLGEILVFVSAIASSMQIILISRFKHHGGAIALCAVQLLIVMCVSLAFVPLESHEKISSIAVTIGILMGLFATAGAILTMNWAQRKVTPIRATVIYALESVWAACFGAMAGEPITRMTVIGGGLIIAGILVSEAMPFIRRRLSLTY